MVRYIVRQYLRVHSASVNAARRWSRRSRPSQGSNEGEYMSPLAVFFKFQTSTFRAFAPFDCSMLWLWFERPPPIHLRCPSRALLGVSDASLANREPLRSIPSLVDCQTLQTFGTSGNRTMLHSSSGNSGRGGWCHNQIGSTAGASRRELCFALHANAQAILVLQRSLQT